MTKLIRISAALVLALVTSSTVYAGFGITPPYVYNDRLTQGSTYTQKIIIVRGDPVDDLKAEVSLNVPGAEGWFDVDRGTEFLLPKGESQVPIHVTVSVPPDAPFDRYQGNIRIKTVPSELGSGVSIALGAQIDVDIRVVDEIRDFEVKRVQIEETEEPHRFWWLDFPGKIRFTSTIENTGNAPVTPSRIAFEIYDKRGTTLLEETEHTNELSKVPEFQTQQVVAELPTFLPPGAYLIKYQIIHYEDQVKREGELTLSVLPAGSIEGYAGYGLMGLSFADKASILALLLLLFGIAAGLVWYFWYLRPRRNRKNPPRESSGGGDALRREQERPEPPRPRTAMHRDEPRRSAPRSPRHSTVDLSSRKRRTMDQ